jgi:uncharacterized membrane protein YedE/YeeE
MRSLGAFVVAIAFGFALSGAGFTSWDEVNRMFVKGGFKARPIHKGSIIGGLLFGVGWALSGGCPSIALAQLGQGQLLAVATLVGIIGGNYLYSVVHARYFNWSIGSCMDD